MAWAKEIKGLEEWATTIDAGVEKCNGSTIVLYRQGKDSRAKSGGPLTEGGWCDAMSIMWIIKSARGESFWDWFKPPHQACPNLKDQKQAGGAGAVVALLRDLSRAGEQKAKLGKGVTAPSVELYMQLNSWFVPKVTHDSPALRQRSGDAVVLQALSGDAMGEAILKTKGYKFIGLSGPGGSHAIVARVVDGTVVFMDPNYGEFFFPTYGDFRKFIRGFWKKYPDKSEIVSVMGFTDPDAMMRRG
jgi:hypothetical protein